MAPLNFITGKYYETQVNADRLTQEAINRNLPNKWAGIWQAASKGMTLKAGSPCVLVQIRGAGVSQPVYNLYDYEFR